MIATSNTMIAKIFAALAVAGLVLGSFAALAPVAGAQTTTTTTSSGSTTTALTFSNDLTIGATGVAVTSLQTFLIAKGFSIPAGATGYFGSQTKAAVAAYQSANGIAPAVGYFGPITRAHVNANGPSTGGGSSTVPGCSAGAMYSSTTGAPCSGSGTGSSGLSGGAGSLDEVKFASSLNNEEVGEGQDDVEVMGLDIKPENSDIALAAVKVTFDHAGGTETSGSATRLDKYADEVSLMLDGNEIARADASSFSKDSTGIYSRTFSLKAGAIIRDGDVGELVVAVSGVSNLNSTEAGEEWGVKVANVRYEDAQGAIITDSSTGNINAYRIFSFEDFATASEQKFRVRSGDSSINTARTIEISATAKTSAVKILSFKVEVEGTSDMNLDEIIVDWAAGNATTSGMVTAAQLFMDGDRVGSESLTLTGTSGVITFDDLDLDLSAGDTYEFEVRVDVAKTAAGYVSGSTFSIDVASSTNWVLEDENGDTVATGKRTGSASSDNHKFVTEGANLALGTVTITPKPNNTTPSASSADFKMQVKVTAVGDTIWVKEGAASSTSVTTGAGYSVVDSAGNAGPLGTTTASFSYISGGTFNSTNSSYEIGEGQTAIFELLVNHDPAASGQFRVVLNSLGFGTAVAGTGSTAIASPSTAFRSSLETISN